jgi:hypothetical protein
MANLSETECPAIANGNWLAIRRIESQAADFAHDEFAREQSSP